MSETIAPPTPKRAAQLRRPSAPARQQRKCVLAVPAWFVVVASYLAVVLAYAFPQDFRNTSPAYVWVAWTAFVIRTFLLHAGLLLSLIAICAVLARRWRLLIASAPLVLLTVGPDVWSYVPKRPPEVAGETITVMSVNPFAGNRSTDPIVREILAARPDVLLVQEYHPRWHAAFQRALAADYPHVHCVVREGNFGLAIYSRRPFVGPVDDALSLGAAGTPQVRAVIRIGGRQVALYNLHLVPPMGRQYVTEQRVEFADLLEHLRREELPVVLAGDFNFTNASPFADALGEVGLTDAQCISGWGRGATWPVLGTYRYLPGIRLDHIFLSGELTSTTCRTGTGQGSDHRPVIAEIGFRAP